MSGSETPRLLLTRYELVLLTLMSEGRPRSEIAETLGTSMRSAQKVHATLLAKLGARTDPHAAAIAFRRGLLPLERRR
jgi:DNA-binding NarL/FixJ family response regulator